MKKIDVEKLKTLDKDKAYIFSIEVGNKSKFDLVEEITYIKKYLVEELKFKCVYFYPTVNGVSEAIFDNFDKYIIEE